METGFQLTRRIIVVLDLAGFARLFQTETDERMAHVVHDYYAACEEVIAKRGGRVIKFMGDGCLAVFPVENAANAVGAVLDMRSRIAEISSQHRISTELGANLHLSSVIEGEFGTGSSKRSDILGRGVNQTFLLGRGAGIRISEPVYRALPSSARSPWNKHKPPAVYHLDEAQGIYEGAGKDPASNALRW
jgi:class 3 adenylate cyclase